MVASAPMSLIEEEPSAHEAPRQAGEPNEHVGDAVACRARRARCERSRAATRAALLGLAVAALGEPGAWAADGQNPTQLQSGGTVEAPTVQLEVGEQRLISAASVRSFSEGVRGVVDVRLTEDGRDFVVVALRPGKTTLLLLKRQGQDQLFRFAVTDPAQAAATPEEGVVRARDNIRLDFYFVQVQRSYTHQLGVSWPSQLGGGGVGGAFDLSGLQSLSGIIDQPLPRLDVAQGSGWAKVMRHATVVTANGAEAKFGGGGEVNVQVQTSVATGIHSIEYGSTIGVLPHYDKTTGRLDLDLQAQVADLRPSGGSGVVGRTTSELKTTVNLALGQSVVLAGLSAESEGRDGSGLPGLSRIPLVGVLFGSHAKRVETTQELIFIVPSVQDAIAGRDEQRLQRAFNSYRRFSGEQTQQLRALPEATIGMQPEQEGL